jgi:hypothetical protein
VELPRDLAWPLLVAVLVMAAALGLLAWLLGPRGMDSGAAWMGLAASLACLLLAVPAATAPPSRLRWDGQRWFLGRPGGAAEAPGCLRVMLDLSWGMLMRFDADSGVSPWRRTVRWLPVRRACLPASWSVLRRTVYSAPPAAGGTGGDGPHTETIRPD